MVLFLRNIFRTNLLRAAGTYGFFSLVNSAMPFFLIPILTRYLTPEEYGLVSVFNIMLSLLVAICGLNLGGAYSRAYFAQDRFIQPVYLGSVISVTILVGIVTLFFIILLKNQFAALFAFPASYLWILPIAATTKCINDIALTHWQVRENPRIYGLFLNFRSLAQALLSIILIVVINVGWQGQVFAIVTSTVIFAFISTIILYCHHDLTLKINWQYLKHALWFGIPLIPHSLSGILNASINRIFISKMVGMTETGIFTIGYQIASIILLLATAFNQAYVPWLFKKLNLKSKSENMKIIKLTYTYFIIIMLCTLVFLILCPVILKLFVGKEFHSSQRYINWIAFGAAFMGMYYMVVNYIFYAEKTYLLAIVTFVSSIMNIGLNYILIKFNGAIGAAQATTITSLLTFLLVWFLATKVYNMPWIYFLKKEISK